MANLNTYLHKINEEYVPGADDISDELTALIVSSFHEKKSGARAIFHAVNEALRILTVENKNDEELIEFVKQTKRDLKKLPW